MKQLLIIAFFGLFLFACAKHDMTTSDKFAQCCTMKPSGNGTAPSMANPASVYCGCVGGTWAVNNTPAGMQGLCAVDGKQFDEWQLFREHCPAPN